MNDIFTSDLPDVTSYKLVQVHNTYGINISELVKLIYLIGSLKPKTERKCTQLSNISYFVQ